MINEQREAIKILKEIQESNRAWLMQTKEENCEKIYLKDIEAIDTVLSLIKEQEEEIERLKTDNGNVWQLNANMSKRHLEDICKLKQKEKQIDLMADFMYKTGTGRKALSCVFGQNDECNENGCEYCIKRYFAGLVEKE